MSWALYGVLFFLAASLLFYVLFAGADFGAGILELFLGKEERWEQRRLISRAMAPVWEANHIWLILVVVILFMGFPLVYTTLSTYLYIPLLAVLVGIVARGCAFTFRHYDTLTTDFHRLYSWVFSLSSVWTSFFLGLLAGAIFLGRVDPAAADFASAYISPWANLFSAAVGLFTVCLFLFLAAIYMTGEADTPNLQRIFQRKAAGANGALVLSGGLVFMAAEASGLPLLRDFLGHPVSLLSFVTATLVLFPFWHGLARVRSATTIRVLGAAIATLILLGWFALQFPFAIRFPAGGLTFAATAAPQATLGALLVALGFGSLLIFPALFYLFRVFKASTFQPPSQHLPHKK